MEVTKRRPVQLGNKLIGVLFVAPAGVPGNQQLAAAVESGEAVVVATPAYHLLRLRGGILAKHVAPDFINLDIINEHALDRFGHVLFAAVAEHNEYVQDNALRGTHHASRGRY